MGNSADLSQMHSVVRALLFDPWQPGHWPGLLLKSWLLCLSPPSPQTHSQHSPLPPVLPCCSLRGNLFLSFTLTTPLMHLRPRLLYPVFQSSVSNSQPDVRTYFSPSLPHSGPSMECQAVFPELRSGTWARAHHSRALPSLPLLPACLSASFCP